VEVEVEVEVMGCRTRNTGSWEVASLPPSPDLLAIGLFYWSLPHRPRTPSHAFGSSYL
jgi:hypothetical protein